LVTRAYNGGITKEINVAEGQKSKDKETTKDVEVTEEQARSLGSAAVTEEVVDDAEQKVKDIDALLDEVDGVLEENAEEFVKGYVQKGGE
jgi:ubiquitin-like protein Pup